MDAELRQKVLDEEHLRLLALFHYVSGGITVAIGAMFVAMIGFMSAMFALMPPETWTPPAHEGMPAPPQPPVGFMLAIFGFVGAVMLAWGILDVVSGRCIARRRGRLFSVIVAIPGLLAFPYGTLLSIFTLIVLERSSVKVLYQSALVPLPAP